MNLQLCKYLISINSELISKTAMSNCHCIGLNSFIINEKPRIRLFIAEQNCELFKEFDILNPIVPIHPHKYDDLFVQLEGTMVNHIYSEGGEHNFNKYKFNRISDNQTHPELIGSGYLDYVGEFRRVEYLKSYTLHTASLEGTRCSWMIIETFEDKKFEQVAYHQNLVERKELYKPLLRATDYLNSYLNIP